MLLILVCDFCLLFVVGRGCRECLVTFEFVGYWFVG